MSQTNVDPVLKVESAPAESTIDKQITKVRDLDSETSKPRIQKKDARESKTSKPSTSTKPLIQLSSILTPYLRNPLTGKPEPEVSRFTPCAFHMFTIIHLMDDCMRKNFYFKRQEDAWHPLLSRLYFGILFIIQTLRSELRAGTISAAHRRFLTKFLRDYPPESLPIPGPLVAIFESLAPATPSNSLYGQVTPAIFDTLIPVTNADLVIIDQAHAFRLALPYIPGILGLINCILNAQPAAIPDFSDPDTFSTLHNVTVNGHLFSRDRWTPAERIALLQPGMLYQVETNRDIDTSFHTYGKRLQLPNPVANDSIASIPNYCFLNANNTWFGNVSKVMSTYSSFFLGSTTLGDTPAQQTAAPLIISDFTKMSTVTAALNPINTLTRAFPPLGVFDNEYQHSTTEVQLPPASAMIAQASKVNCRTTLPNLSSFSFLGHDVLTRSGPYWSHYPKQSVSAKENTSQNLGSIISTKYCLVRAKPPRE